jgi:hypothetical protein
VDEDVFRVSSLILSRGFGWVTCRNMTVKNHD